jgi:hypothetical protein
VSQWGSSKETITAIRKAKVRNLITDDEFNILDKKLNEYFFLVSKYIDAIGRFDCA